ncbi:hypothetical protein LPICM02_40096 [Pseudolactococcus piscium]|nr:hypothetical protein LPICM02_40096 [Lactococcus piscium]
MYHNLSLHSYILRFTQYLSILTENGALGKSLFFFYHFML